MKRILSIGLIAVLCQLPCVTSALAWGWANRWGGATVHTWGRTDHVNAWGGSTDHVWGVGTEHTNVYGGTTWGAWGAGVAHSGPYAGTAYRPPGYGYYPAYHPPVAVPYYGASCYGCAAAAGAVVGAAAGAVAGAAAASYVIGNMYATLPAGCVRPTVAGTVYYMCGSTWFLPSYGANGVYYRAVPPP